MRKKDLILIPLSILLIVSVSSQTRASELLRLTGQVTELKIVEEDAKTVRLRIGVDLALKNDSDGNVIIYRSDSPLLNLNFFTWDVNGKQVHLFTVGGGASNYHSPETLGIQKQLDKDFPPEALVNFIRAHDSFNFRTETECVFFKSRNMASANMSWSEISKTSPISIQLKLEMFPSYLKKPYKSGAFFEKQLQDRWKKYGHLLLDDIFSEPIPINLNMAVVKASSQR